MDDAVTRRFMLVTGYADFLGDEVEQALEKHPNLQLKGDVFDTGVAGRWGQVLVDPEFVYAVQPLIRL